jgi:hypothetical protein
MVSICRDSSARALVWEIVRDWFKDAIFAVPTPISTSSGMLVKASLMDGGMLLFTLRPFRLVEAVSPVVDAALPDEAHDAAVKTAMRQTQTKRVLFIFQLHIKNLVFIRKHLYKKRLNAFYSKQTNFSETVLLYTP